MSINMSTGVLITRFCGIVTSISALGVLVASFFLCFVYSGRSKMRLVPPWCGSVEVAQPARQPASNQMGMEGRQLYPKPVPVIGLIR